MELNTPKLMTVRQIAKTGIISEGTLRRLIKQGTIKPLYSGNRALLNYNSVCQVINTLTFTDLKGA